MIREAVISGDRKYRYELTRTWDGNLDKIVWIMLNPSTADATKDDATIRRCIKFSQREGAGGIIVLNLFAFRTAYPVALWREASDPHGDPVGPDNNGYLYAIPYGTRIAAAWGTHNKPMFRVRVQETLQLLEQSEIECLGLTACGDPKHPVRLASDTKFEIYKQAHLNFV